MDVVEGWLWRGRETEGMAEDDNSSRMACFFSLQDMCAFVVADERSIHTKDMSEGEIRGGKA
jgi:hypothetical protein